jgi:hypothetical protein
MSVGQTSVAEKSVGQKSRHRDIVITQFRSKKSLSNSENFAELLKLICNHFSYFRLDDVKLDVRR